jgi:acetyltransferase-like isoleucine patch superfamily enzyme
MPVKPLILIGGGGHCRSCIDVIETTDEWQIKGILDQSEKIGTERGALVNTAALIEHDVHIGHHTHISTGATLNGGVSISDSCFIGSGSIVSNGLSISNGMVLGAGSLVIRNLPASGSTYAGAPCKILGK